jgi:OCT family organic cation transporter-like MFS transporter 4/5
MKFDDIFKEIGEFGPYQRRIYVMLAIGYMFTQPGMVLSVFVLGLPDHRYASLIKVYSNKFYSRDLR